MVPIQLARIVPINIIKVLTTGVPTREPVNLTPPDIVNNASSKIIKGIYSRRDTCKISYKVTLKPSFIKKGKTNEAPQNNEIFPK